VEDSDDIDIFVDIESDEVLMVTSFTGDVVFPQKE
jgi:hypothetical protein